MVSSYVVLRLCVCADCTGEFSTLLGMASPPTSYGGYGGNANEKPKYTFEYPTGWKSEVPSKVCAGMSYPRPRTSAAVPLTVCMQTLHAAAMGASCSGVHAA